MDNGASSYRRFLAGDREGLAEIVREYSDGLILYINSFVKNICVSEELMEDVFVEIAMVIRLSENEVLVSGVVEADSDSLGEQVNEITLRPTCYTNFLPEELTAQIYIINSNNLKKQVAVRFTGSEKFIIYNIVKA
ncbi:hypothetical protein SAMN02910353_00389 [Ruminococcus sp. YRD2003]|uniref:hypothetical protein n=1 Tax=Ruminococcus sp. YRD2003 TaxID=1452313 RepID=UPI0008B90DA5|nr:hypothetical protein SAMN02910353_00389 [Ruminococcus flavefaciens]